MSPFIILVGLALLFTVAYLIWQKPPLLPIAVLLVCVALLIGPNVKF